MRQESLLNDFYAELEYMEDRSETISQTTRENSLCSILQTKPVSVIPQELF